MLILLCIWPFNLCHIAVKLLLWFQRVGHLVHCGEQSGPTCKIPARQVLRQELLHHSECKHLPTNCPRQMRCEIMQLILDLLCLILSRVLQFRRQLSWKPGFAATTCITGLGRRQKRCVLCCIHIHGPSNHDYCLAVFFFAYGFVCVLCSAYCGCGHLGRLSHGLRQGCRVGCGTGLQHGPAQGNTGWRIWQVLVVLQTVHYPGTLPLPFTHGRIQE